MTAVRQEARQSAFALSAEVGVAAEARKGLSVEDAALVGVRRAWRALRCAGHRRHLLLGVPGAGDSEIPWESIECRHRQLHIVVGVVGRVRSLRWTGRIWMQSAAAAKGPKAGQETSAGRSA